MGNVPPSALRQPPPPGRGLLIESNKVSAPTTSKAEGDTSRVRSRTFYFRRCKKANPSNLMIESLPDELLIEILLRLSADDIYDNARLVCRRWRHLIHTDVFVSAHLQRASTGLLFKSLLDLHTHNQSSPIFLTATTQGRVEVSELSCRAKFPILCSCNGLALCLREYGCRKTPFIFNPATKSAFNLPRVPVTGPPVERLVMAYAAASMAYKVVGTYLYYGFRQCGILTVGVDNTWRDVAVEGLSPEASWLVMECPLLITRGFVHWVPQANLTCLDEETRILSVSLNLETEIFTETRIPDPILHMKSNYEYCYLSTGESLTLFISCGEFLWEVWEMKPATWEWRKVIPIINLEAHKCKIQQFALETDDLFVEPVGWVRYPEVLAFFMIEDSSPSCIIYYLDADQIDSIELSTATSCHSVVQHRNTLVWTEQC